MAPNLTKFPVKPSRKDFRLNLRRSILFVLTFCFSFQALLYTTSATASTLTSLLPDLAKRATQKLGYKIEEKGEISVMEGEETMAKIASMASSPEVHARFKPSVFFKSLAHMTKEVTTDTIMHFPPEAFAFFLANGAVAFSKGFLDYADNPVALKQYIESQYLLQWKETEDPRTHVKTSHFDPAGLFNWLGFAAFMEANGMTMAVWNALRGSKTGAIDKFMPFFGMEMGMKASAAVGNLSNFAEINKCIADVHERIGKPGASGEDANTPDKFETCDKVYDSMWGWFKSGFKGATPEMASLIVGTVLAELPMALVVNPLITISRWDVAMLLTPGGGEMPIAHFAYKVIQLYSFMGLNTYAEKVQDKLNLLWSESDSMMSAEDQMLAALREAKQNNWAPTVVGKVDDQAALDDASKYGEKAIPFALQNLRDSARGWRNTNMKSFETSAGAWTQYLADYIINYTASEHFYKAFGKALTEKIHGENNLNGVPFIDAAQPLFGVGTDTSHNKQETLGDVGHYQALQLHNLVVKNKAAKLKWTDQELLKFEVPLEDVKVFTKVIQDIPETEQMSATQINQIGRNFDSFNALIKTYSAKSIWGKSAGQKAFLQAMIQLRTLFGDDKAYPAPKWEKGEGFIASYELDGKEIASKDHNSGLRLPHDPILGDTAYGFRLDSPSDYFVASMVAGPDPKIPGSLVDTQQVTTYPARFLPPKIAAIDSASVMKSGGQQSNTTSGPVKVTIPGHSYTFPSAFSILRPDFLDPEFVADPDKFWDTRVLTQFEDGYDKFATSYQKVAGRFIDIVNNKKDDVANRSNYSINPVMAIRQEVAVDLFVLGDLYKDIVLKNADAKLELEPQKSVDPEAPGLKGLFETAKTTNNFDDQTWMGLNDPYPKMNLKFQTEVIGLVDQLASMLQNFKTPSTNGGTRITSNYSNVDFNVAFSKIETALKEIVARFKCQNLTPYQEATVTLALKGIYSAAGKLSVYGRMLNTATYVADPAAGPAAAKAACDKEQAAQAKDSNDLIQRQMKNCSSIAAAATKTEGASTGFTVELNSCGEGQ